MRYLIILLLLPVSAYGACSGSSPTLTAVDASYTEVNACVTAAVNGDTINVPAGNYSWGFQLRITKNISLIGAGKGNTIITNTSGSAQIFYDPSSVTSDLFRVSGFTFNGNGTGGGMRLYNNALNPPITNIRIDNNRFTNSTQTSPSGGIDVYGVRGVVDNNTFDNLRSHVRSWGDNTSFGTWDWDNFPELVFGTADDNMYFEDNTFEFGSSQYMIADQNQGGRYAFRYNTFTHTSAWYPWFDIHGTGTVLRHGMGGEIYGNVFSHDGFLMSHRGGRLAMHHNKVTNGSTAQYNIYNNDKCPLEFKEVVNNTYVYLNRHGFTGAFVLERTGGGDVCPSWPTIAENTTFFMDNALNDGTVGVGAGPLASMPSTCTTGVGYWATDQSTTDLTGLVGVNPTTPIDGTLYKCTSTDTWTSHYTPYTYPHPLRGEGVASTSSFSGTMKATFR